MNYDDLVLMFHKKRHEDKAFNAFYRSSDFSLWVCDLIKDGSLTVQKNTEVFLQVGEFFFITRINTEEMFFLLYFP